MIKASSHRDRDHSELGPNLVREQGSYCTGKAGPLVIIVAGMHGNEPSGIIAARRVLQQLEQQEVPLRGRLLALAGNLSSLALGVRYVKEDLNRMWFEDAVAAVLARDPADLRHEERDQRELIRLIESWVTGERSQPWQQVVFMDLHSTSGAGPPFTILGDTLRNREIAFEFGIPAILGLEENIGGTLLGFLSSRGYAAVGVEGGQHDEASTIDNHEAAIWLTLVASGMLWPREVPELDRHRVCLAAAASGTPSVVELRYRHGLEEDEEFEMVEGLTNFLPVQKGRLLAHAQRRDEPRVEVHCREDGILLLPRYQGQGLDGFFIGRRVDPRWLALSSRLRRLKLDSMLAYLPGVSRPDGIPGRLRVDQRVARWLTLQLFHLLGYRRRRVEGNHVIFDKRIENPPES